MANVSNILLGVKTGARFHYLPVSDSIEIPIIVH